jgi:two-component system OmpR family sensor kinase
VDLKPRRQPVTGPPIALQIMALLLAGMIAAHALSFAVVVLLPPPRPPVWRIAEVAGALQGGPLKLRDGRTLTRRIVAAPPADEELQRRSAPWRAALADALHVPPDQVRLTQARPPFFFMPGVLTTVLGVPIHDMRHQEVEHLETHRVEGHDHAFGPGGPGDPHGGPPMEFRRMVFERQFMIGDFTAAARLADGRWTVVASPPEPFPNDWQSRVMLWFAGCLVVIALAGYLFGRRITAPIRAFSDAAERLGRDPRQGGIPLRGPAEIGKAAAAFNRMQERLKRYVDDRTAMVAAISHDLRTPLARIRFKLEAAPEDVRAAVTRDVERMEEMIDAVLAFVRDASEPSRRERLDLRSLVEVAADDAAVAGPPLEVEGDETPVIVDGDAPALSRLFGNLIDNAVKHGGGGSARVFQEDDQAVVEIADDGPGVAAADLERVFQPFYRAEAARTLTENGVGLGLAVARSIARAHGGDVVLIARTPKGLTARVTLPLAAKR